VLDIPGGAGKVSVGPSYIATDGNGAACAVIDNEGRRHAYPPTRR
jgi:lysine 2,3-aminomutase